MLSSALLQRRKPATRIPVICVVDPKPDDYEGWESQATASGARLHIVAGAEEALRFSRTTAVDLWVVNTQLTGLSGCELCSMLKARSPAVPVYLFADSYSPAVEQAARQARATLFGVKPEHQTWLSSWVGRHAPHCSV